MDKPAWIVDRDPEWDLLDRFALGDLGRLAVVWGSRRIGKSYLLEALCEAHDGLYIQMNRQDAVPALNTLGRAIGERSGVAAAVRVDDWVSAVDLLLDVPDTPIVVLDEFPYLVAAEPALPSILQAAVDRRRPHAARLILCGSAVAQMTRLLASDAPLYRRARVAMALMPFDLRTSAEYWGLAARPRDALRVHAVVGGAPGYRDALGEVGRSVDAWIVDRVLDPSNAVFYEDDLTLATDPTLTDANVYRSVMAAIGAGARTPTAVARQTGRKVTSLVRPLDRLERSGLVIRTPDPLRANRSLLDVGDPFLRFHAAVIQPHAATVRRRRGAELWARLADTTFPSKILGPHFERVCRDAALDYDLGLPYLTDVGATTIYDPARRISHDIDVVGVEGEAIVLLGEAKAGGRRTIDDLRRLERLRELVPERRRGGEVHLALFAAGGADGRLRREAASRSDFSLIDLDALYGR